MSMHTAEGLKEQIERIAKEIEPTLTEIIEIAAFHETAEQQQDPNAPHYAETFRRIFLGIKQDTFKLIIIGRFSNGKSTLLNALMGRLPDEVLQTVREVSRKMAEQARQEAEEEGEEDDDEEGYTVGEQGPLPTSDMATTPVLTEINYGKEPQVWQQHKNGEWEEQTLAWYLEEARVKRTSEESQQAFADVVQFRLALPAPLCEGSITLIDSPGIENSYEHNDLVYKALALSDAAIILFRTDSLLTLEEREFMRQIHAMGIKHAFSLVNRWNGRRVDNNLKAFVWERLVQDVQRGPAHTNPTTQDFAERNIYFVDALRALSGRFNDNEKDVDGSGLTVFERHLNNFLHTESFAVHIERFLEEAERTIADLQSLLSKRLPLLSVDSARYEERLERYKPELQALKNRAGKIHTLFRKHLRECQQELAATYESLMVEICQQLPAVVTESTLPGLEGWSRVTANFHRQELLEQAFKIAQEFVNSKVEAWQEADKKTHGPQYIITIHLDKMFDEIIDEITQIEKAYEAIRFALSEGGQVDKGTVTLAGPGLAERIGAAALGVAIGAWDIAIMGTVDGFKGAGRYALGAAAVAIPLLIIGAPLLPVIVPLGMIAGMATNIIWGTNSLEKEVKKKVIDLIIYGDYRQNMHGLREAHLRDRPALDRAVEEVFRNIQERFEPEVRRRMEEEEWLILNQESKSTLSLEESQEQIKRITASLERLEELRTRLRDGLAASQQG